MRPRSTTAFGRASRSFIAGIRLWPPASSLASSPCCATRFADALDAQRIARRGRDGAAERVVGNVRGARHRVVHEFTGQKLAVLVVDGLFEEHLSDRMRDAALHLSFDEERVDLRSAVVDR